MLRVKPIYGSTGHHGSSKSISLPPSCTLIEYGGVRVLVNVGFDESLTFPNDGKDHSDSTVDRAGANAGVANTVPSSLPDVDAVLLTDSSLQSIGGLPRYFGSSFGNNGTNTRQPRIYATFPTVKMGQMNLYDNHANISLDGGNPGYSLSDVDDLFSPLVLQSGDSDGQISGNINPGDNSEPSKLGSSSSSSSTRTIQPIQTIKYAQTIIIKDPNTQKPAIAITPQRAGHLIGASYFTLKRLTDETEVVVAPIYHHAKEKHLDNSTLYEYASACDVLVTTCGGPGSTLGSLYIPPDRMYKSKPILKPPKVATDERELIESILSTLRRGGNVLLPTDASGRVLELLYLLNEHWERHRLGSAYNLCWVGSMVHNTVEFARSQLEWMAGPLGAQFDTGRGHPFSLKGVKMFSTVAELEANCLSSGDVNGLGGVDSDSNPCCVLASGATLDCGPARDLFLKWSENADNAIILTDSRRCVQRGSVIQSRVLKAGSDALPTGSARSPSKDSSASIAGVSNNSSIPTLASGGETPNIVQEDEEAGAISIGSALTIDRTSEYSTAGQLLLKWCEAKAAREEMADLIDCDTMVPKRAPLAGAELKTFLQQEEAKRLKEKAAEERRAMLREVELAKGRLRLIEEEAAPTGGSSKAVAVAGTNASSTKAKDIKGQDVASRPKKKSRFDANLFLKYSKPCHMTFEVREEAVGIGQPDSIAKYGIGESIGRAGEVLEDDYGIAVEAERFVDIVSGVDPNKFAKGGRLGDEVRRRGLGFGSDGSQGLHAAGGAGQDVDGTGGDGVIDSLDLELALEAEDLSEGNGIIRGRSNRPPIKVSTEPRRLEVLAEIAYVPVEARVDTKAARNMIRSLQPRQVVVLGSGKPAGVEGDQTNPVNILTYVMGGRESTFAPTDGETAELSVGHAAYAVRLIDTPYMTREEKSKKLVEGEETANVEPHEAKVGGCTVSLLDCIATGQKVAADGSLVLAPRGQSQNHRPNVMLSHGDVLLPKLREKIINEGMKAEYSAHAGYSQLIVNGRIVVRKDQESGEINVEGPLCEDFFRVREVVCYQYVQV